MSGMSLLTGAAVSGGGGPSRVSGSSATITGPIDYDDLINKPTIPNHSTEIQEINDFMDLDFGLLSTSRAPQNKTGIYIPFYVYPNFGRTDFKKSFDDMMQILDENQDVPVLAVINPGDGPLIAGYTEPDPVYEELLGRSKKSQFHCDGLCQVW